MSCSENKKNINVSDEISIYFISVTLMVERPNNYHIQLRTSWWQRNHLLHRKLF